MNRRVLLTLTLTFLLTEMISAQNIFNSPYSVYGVGMIQDRLSSMNRGMSGTGIGVQDPLNLNHLNPASYGSILQPINHIYEIGFYGERDHFATLAAKDSRASGGLTNISYWFRFKPWWSANAGLSPYSSMSYNIRSTRELGTGTSVPYNYSGSGNIASVYLGNSFRISKNFSLGLNVNFLIGSITKSETLDITNSLTLERKISARKFTLDAGAQYKFEIGKRSLVIGVVADNGVNLVGTVRHALYTGDADTLQSGTDKKVSYHIPASGGIGLGLHSKRSIIAVDLKYQHWQQASFANEDVIFQDTWRVSTGYYYRGNPDATHYFGSLGFRAGAYAQQFQLQLKGNSLPLWGFSAGIAIPAFDTKSTINLTYGFDQLGTTKDGLIRQQSQKFIFEVVIRDLWGFRRRYD